MKENPLSIKSYDVMLTGVSLFKKHTLEHQEYILLKQLCRSGISIACIESLKTQYSSGLLRDSDPIPMALVKCSIDTDELSKIMFSMLKTT